MGLVRPHLYMMNKLNIVHEWGWLDPRLYMMNKMELARAHLCRMNKMGLIGSSSLRYEQIGVGYVAPLYDEHI